MVPNFFDKENYVLYLRLWLKLKINTPRIRIQSMTMTKTMCWINKSRKNENKDRIALYKLMNNAVNGKTMKNLRNRIDSSLISNEKDYLKWTLKPS